MTIISLAEQLKDLRSDISHRACLRVFNLLEGNKKVFLQYIEADSFAMLLRNFEELSNSNPVTQSSERYKDDYKRNFELLMFYLNRVI